VVRFQGVELLATKVKLIFFRKKWVKALKKPCGIGNQAPIHRLWG
jgi:hypothetical protein